MRVKVLLFGGLARFAGASSFQLELEVNSNVEALLTELDRHTDTPVRPMLVRPEGVLSPSYAMMCNGSNILLPEGLESQLSDGDEVAVVPRIAGGVA